MHATLNRGLSKPHFSDYRSYFNGKAETIKVASCLLWVRTISNSLNQLLWVLMAVAYLGGGALGALAPPFQPKNIR